MLAVLCGLQTEKMILTVFQLAWTVTQVVIRVQTCNVGWWHILKESWYTFEKSFKALLESFKEEMIFLK